MKNWKIVLASDHAGLDLKRQVHEYLTGLGCQVVDVGTHTADRCDYPDYALLAARRLTAGESELGIFVCGTGLGMAMTANKVPGLRAAPCNLEYLAEMARRHNEANVLCLGGRVLTAELARRIVLRFLETEPEGGRHALRVERLRQLDRTRGESC